MKILSDIDIKEVQNHFNDKRISQSALIEYLGSIYPTLYFSSSESKTKEYLSGVLSKDEVFGKAFLSKENMSFTIDRPKRKSIETFKIIITENSLHGIPDYKTYSITVI